MMFISNSFFFQLTIFLVKIVLIKSSKIAYDFSSICCTEDKLFNLSIKSKDKCSKQIYTENMGSF